MNHQLVPQILSAEPYPREFLGSFLYKMNNWLLLIIIGNWVPALMTSVRPLIILSQSLNHPAMDHNHKGDIYVNVLANGIWLSTPLSHFPHEVMAESCFNTRTFLSILRIDAQGGAGSGLGQIGASEWREARGPWPGSKTPERTQVLGR